MKLVGVLKGWRYAICMMGTNYRLSCIVNQLPCPDALLPQVKCRAVILRFDAIPIHMSHMMCLTLCSHTDTDTDTDTVTHTQTHTHLQSLCIAESCNLLLHVFSLPSDCPFTPLPSVPLCARGNLSLWLILLHIKIHCVALGNHTYVWRSSGCKLFLSFFYIVLNATGAGSQGI